MTSLTSLHSVYAAFTLSWISASQLPTSFCNEPRYVDLSTCVGSPSTPYIYNLGFLFTSLTTHHYLCISGINLQALPLCSPDIPALLSAALPLTALMTKLPVNRSSHSSLSLMLSLNMSIAVTKSKGFRGETWVDQPPL